MDRFTKDVKGRFTQFCREQKITQMELSNAIGVSLNSIGRWFNATLDTMPSIYALYWIRKEHKLNINWLTTGEGEPITDEEADSNLVKRLEDAVGETKSNLEKQEQELKKLELLKQKMEHIKKNREDALKIWDQIIMDANEDGSVAVVVEKSNNEKISETETEKKEFTITVHKKTLTNEK